MPLADGLDSAEIGWIESHKRALAEFANKISSCIDNSEWEMLVLTLESRQAYLEQLFTTLIPDNCRNSARQLAESILEQDKFFQAKLEEQKNIAGQLQLTLERGRRAIKAYSNQ